MSVATFLTDWIADQQVYLRPRTWTGYKGNVDNHIEYVHTILHKALDQAVHDQLVSRNVAHETRPPSSKRPKVAPGTAD